MLNFALVSTFKVSILTAIYTVIVENRLNFLVTQTEIYINQSMGVYILLKF